MQLDPLLFSQAAIAPETQALNEDIVAKLQTLPDIWAFPPALIRQLRREGHGPFPLPPFCPHAEIRRIGSVPVRIIRPQTREATGFYLHFHGGGWTFGAADFQDPRLERIAEHTGLISVSVEYRLAPEHPYPAGPDDCEGVALWLVREGHQEFGVSSFFIGGESAGGHLALVTLLRLRDRHGITSFSGMNLVAGCFDLSLTPSARQWGDLKLVMNTRDVRKFVESFVPSDLDVRLPDISPLYASLHHLPPALISVGTRDPILDDSLFLASRLLAAGCEVQLALHPGGCHAFEAFDSPLTEISLARMDQFFQAALEAGSVKR